MLGSDSPIPPQLSPFTRCILAEPGLGVTLRVVLSAEMELGTRWVTNGFVTEPKDVRMLVLVVPKPCALGKGVIVVKKLSKPRGVCRALRWSSCIGSAPRFGGRQLCFEPFHGSKVKIIL